MKNLTLALIMVLPVMGFSQTLLDTLCMEIPYRKGAPAPCTIEDTSTIESKLFLVKVGLYDRKIESRDYIMRIDLGSQYHYFYQQIFRTREKATAAATSLRQMGFCDAYVVELPSIIMGFEFNPPTNAQTTTQTLSLPTKTATQPKSGTQSQLGGKVTWIN